MKILVTGAAGFIGSAVCRKLVTLGHNVIAVDCFLPNLYSNDRKRLQWDSLSSLPNLELLEHDLRVELHEAAWDGVEAVINEAGMPGLMNSWSEFDTYASCNLNVVEKIATNVANRQIERFVQISTSSVYGSEAVGDESTFTEPISPYGVTKLAAEELVKAYSRTFGLKYTILRYFSVYGPGQRPDMAYSRIIDAVLTGDEISIFGDGEQTRTNTYVDDCAEATVNAVLRPSENITYNVSGNERLSLNQAISTIEETLGRRAKTRTLPARPGDQRHTMGDNKRAVDELGLVSSVSMHEGLARQAEWQRELRLGNWITPSPWQGN